MVPCCLRPWRVVTKNPTSRPDYCRLSRPRLASMPPRSQRGIYCSMITMWRYGGVTSKLQFFVPFTPPYPTTPPCSPSTPPRTRHVCARPQTAVAHRAARPSPTIGICLFSFHHAAAEWQAILTALMPHEGGQPTSSNSTTSPPSTRGLTEAQPPRAAVCIS